jgi:hypothetical protein
MGNFDYIMASDIRDIESRRSDLNLYFIEDSHVYHMNDLKGVNSNKWPSVSRCYINITKNFQPKKHHLKNKR